MSVAVVLIAQAGAMLGLPDAAGFDLRAVEPAKTCASGGGEIVVCGHRADDEAFRLRPLPERFAETPPRATIGLGNDNTLGVEGGRAAFANGDVSNRVMLTLKVPF